MATMYNGYHTAPKEYFLEIGPLNLAEQNICDSNRVGFDLIVLSANKLS